MRPIVLFFILSLPIAPSASAGDWPQFRGPAGSGVSEEIGLPVTWGPPKNLRWQADLPGRGLSCPVVSAGRVYVTACSGATLDRLHVLAFDVGTGQRLWERQFWATGNTMCHPKTTMAAPTPVTDGKTVYALFGTGDLACFTADGDLLWYRSVMGDYPTVGNNLGLAASPVLCQDVLILPMESVGESFVAGLDTHTGRNRWRVERARGLNWVTPLVLHTGGHTDVVLQSPQELTGYDPRTGRKRWQYKAGGLGTAPSPIAGNGLVLTAGGDFLALRPGTDEAAPKVVWQSAKLKTAYSTPLFHRERIYAVNSAGVLNCADAVTGKGLWQQRLKGSFSASPVIGDGKLYLVNEEGETSVVQLGGEPKVLAVNALKDTILATPAIAGGAIFLRSDQKLYCIAK
jgi:outer membrane protein assembly factor BamB